MTKRSQLSGLDALKAIRDRVPNSVLKTVIASPKPTAPATPAPPDEPDDPDFFDAEPDDTVAGVSFATSYDGGSENVETYSDGGASQFLFELIGVSAHDYVVDGTGSDADYILNAVSGADGGQYISLHGPANDSPRSVGVSTVKVWRVEGVVPPPQPTPEFWTSFIGSREII